MQRVLEQLEAHYKEKEITGNGITVAVLDSGCARHPDVMGRMLCFQDFVNHKQLMYDDNGHGTFVSSILCGTGISSGFKYSGVAPKADIISIKALKDNGETGAFKILEAMKWVYDNQKKYNINMMRKKVYIQDMQEENFKKIIQLKKI